MHLLLSRTIILKRLFILMLLVTTACDRQAISQNEPSKPTATIAVQKPARSGDETGELVHQGRKRTYYLHTPKAYKPNKPMPLVLAFHGYGSQGKNLADNTGFSELADQKGFIIVYPDGLDLRWDVASNSLTGVDDVSFVTALIEHLTQIRSVDTKRIYATGVSNGGFLVQRLACEQKSQIAAFASVAATFPGQLKAYCNPSTPIPMLMINGTDDRKVPWEGGSPPITFSWFLSVPNTIDFWRQYNNCTAPGQVKQLPGDRVEITLYPNCKNGAEVELVKLKGVGHVWPRGGSGPNQLLNGSQEIWNFFQKHKISQ